MIGWVLRGPAYTVGGLNVVNKRLFITSFLKFSYFNTGMVVLIDFIEISIKSTRNINNTN